jgi:hydroxymethylpyrimidine/phosphomethylpyrimidine kinase
MPIALSVAGSDPTGGAGLQLDLQVFRALGVHGAGVITALTVQDTEKVHRVLPVFPSVILDQLRVVVRDLAVAAVKVGMLGTDDGLRAVAHGLEDPAACELPIVLDPVLESSSGAFLLERRAWPALVSFFPRAALVTPNVPELAALAEADVSTRAGIETGARRLVAEANAQAVLVTGGHLEGAPDDLLARREEGGGVRLDWLPGERIEGEAVHGTGCALSSAIAAEIAKGAAIDEAVAAARAFVRDALRRARKVGRGARLLGLP